MFTKIRLTTIVRSERNNIARYFLHLNFDVNQHAISRNTRNIID